MLNKNEPSLNSRLNAFRARASVTVEIATMAFLFFIFAILAIDVVVVIMGYSILDSASRDAARAAAAAAAANSQTAYQVGYQLAKNACNQQTTDTGLIGQPSVTNFVFADGLNGDPNSSPYQPYVTVTASNYVKVPIPINDFGAQFQPGAGGKITFTRSYTFPILHAKNIPPPPPPPPAPPPPPPPPPPPLCNHFHVPTTT